MAKCVHGIEECIHIDKEHDEDSCFNGWWEHLYYCNECGHELQSRKHSIRIDGKTGMFIPPGFKPMACPKCKTPGSMS